MVASAWDFWRSIGSPRHVCAPMVDQSEAAFRVLTRSLGVQLAYTPMLHARLMVEAPAYRAHTFDPEPDGVDRPLVAQLAGHDASVLLAAGRLVQVWATPALERSFTPFALHRTFGGHGDDATLLDVVSHGFFHRLAARTMNGGVKVGSVGSDPGKFHVKFANY